MTEIAWLKEQGLVSCYEDYLALPFAVLEDARMLAEGVAHQQQRQQQAARTRR